MATWKGMGMSDLVKRLRDDFSFIPGNARTAHNLYERERHEAADRIDALEAALSQCQGALAMLIAPGAIQGATVLSAFAAVTAAEAKARAVIGADPEPINQLSADATARARAIINKGNTAVKALEENARPWW